MKCTCGRPRVLAGMKSGERGQNRTVNLLIKSQLLCQLSYAPTLGDKQSFYSTTPPRASPTSKSGMIPVRKKKNHFGLDFAGKKVCFLLIGPAASLLRMFGGWLISAKTSTGVPVA